MIYLNSYSIDELGLKMRNIYILFMFLSAISVYYIFYNQLNEAYTFIVPLLYTFLNTLLFLSRNTFHKNKKDIILFSISSRSLYISFLFFILSPLLMIFSIPYTIGDLLHQISLAFFINFILGYLSFKIIFPNKLSRNHAIEYRQSAIMTNIMEEKSSHHTVASINIAPVAESLENTQKIMESEKIISELTNEQEKLLKSDN
jgi:hypothetical protein